MSEPKNVVERVSYILNPTKEMRAVSIRRNRTSGETNSQFYRLYNEIARMPKSDEKKRKLDRLTNAFSRVSAGLAATGRDDEWASDYITLIGRAKARRLNRK